MKIDMSEPSGTRGIIPSISDGQNSGCFSLALEKKMKIIKIGKETKQNINTLREHYTG